MVGSQNDFYHCNVDLVVQLCSDMARVALTNAREERALEEDAMCSATEETKCRAEAGLQPTTVDARREAGDLLWHA